MIKNHIDYFFMCAAVSDYKLKNIPNEKIKRVNMESNLQIIPTPDILKSIKNIIYILYKLCLLKKKRKRLY